MADIFDKRPWPLRHRIQCDIMRVFFLVPLLSSPRFWSVTFLRGGFFSFFLGYMESMWCMHAGPLGVSRYFFLVRCLPVCILMGASLGGDAFALRRPVRRRLVRKVGEGSVGYVMYSRGGSGSWCGD
ncbi:hypothetical protein J3E68DRAFT_398298 [Trichoderma sp. SZMC 28012]